MSREHELFQELRKARVELAGAKEDEVNARVELADRKADRRKAEALVEEILTEIETGKTDRPIIDQINGRAAGKPPDPPEEPETADEKQRGPTEHGMSPLNRVSVKPPKRKPKTERADSRPRARASGAREVAIPERVGTCGSPKGPIRQMEDHLAKLDAEANDRVFVDPMDGVKTQFSWTSADLERELEAACKIRGIPGPGRTDWPWPALQKTGCDDRKILEVLRAIWPAGYEVLASRDPKQKGIGCTVHGGPTPAFWVGARKSTDWKIAPPTLEGLRLADRVRTVLEIPRAQLQPGSALALESWGPMYTQAARDTARVCNKCHNVRLATVGLCPYCKSPEFRPLPVALAEAKGEKPPVPTAEATAADKPPVRKRRKAAAV